MLNALRFLVVFFLLVAVPRVAAYAANFATGIQLGGFDFSSLIALSFAIGLGAAVFLTTYASSIAMNRIRELEASGITPLSGRVFRQLKKKTTRTKAEKNKLLENMEIERIWSAFNMSRFAAFLFAIIEGLFNLAEVLSTAITAGTIQAPLVPAGNGLVDLISVWIFALMPTISSIVLALVIASLDRAGTSLDLNLDLLGREIGVAKRISKKETTTPKRGEKASWWTDLDTSEAVYKHSKVEELREKSFDEMTTKEYFITTMYNRMVDNVDSGEVSKDLNVSQRSVQRWLEEIRELRAEANAEHS